MVQSIGNRWVQSCDTRFRKKGDMPSLNLIGITRFQFCKNYNNVLLYFRAIEGHHVAIPLRWDRIPVSQRKLFDCKLNPSSRTHRKWRGHERKATNSISSLHRTLLGTKQKKHARTIDQGRRKCTTTVNGSLTSAVYWIHLATAQEQRVAVLADKVSRQFLSRVSASPTASKKWYPFKMLQVNIREFPRRVSLQR